MLITTHVKEQMYFFFFLNKQKPTMISQKQKKISKRLTYVLKPLSKKYNSEQDQIH